MQALGRLETVDLRSIWPDEARDFTPWLVQNISLLGEAIGMDLGIIESEGPVGPYRVDIICEDLASRGPVIVENVLGATDHDHLGKLLTYSAGREAKAAVLISTDFRDEHLKALEWLNELSGGDHLFFGVRVRVVRIADSPPAPVLDVVVQPNDWENQVKPERGAKSELGAAYETFFSQLLANVKLKLPGTTTAKRAFPQNWFGFPTGRSGYIYNVCFAKDSRLRVELIVDLRGFDATRAAYEHLLLQKESIETDFGERLTWEQTANRRSCRIAVYRPGSIGDAQEKLTTLIDEATYLIGCFQKAFKDRISKVPNTFPTLGE